MNESSTTASMNGTILYHYQPSLALAATFCVGFLISAILHTYQTCITRSWYMLPILIGCTCEGIGYVGRVLGSTEFPDVSLAPYIVQAILLLVAPALIAASIYMIMGYVVRATDGDRYCLVREQLLTKVFVIGDVFSFFIQSSGAGLLTKKEQDSKDAGNWIIIGGLAIQLIFFGFFMVVTVLFWGRLQADGTRASQLKHAGVPWRMHVSVLLFSSVLVMIRSVFRVVEYVQGQNGYLLTHEIYLYIFDASLMFVAVVVFNIFHPTQLTSIMNAGRAIKKIVLVVEASNGQSLKQVQDPEYAAVAMSEQGQR